MYMCVNNTCHDSEDGSEMLQKLTHVMMKELIAHETWHWVMWSRWRDQDKTWLDGPVASVKDKLSDDLVLIDLSNDEEQVKSRSMNQYDHVMI
jgi:hypothetical protein